MWPKNCGGDAYLFEILTASVTSFLATNDKSNLLNQLKKQLFRSVNILFKFIVQFSVCCFLGFLCIVCSSIHLHNFRACFYNTCVIFSFICTLLVLLARLFQLWQRKFYKLNAVKYEFYLHVFLAFTCFTAGCVSISLDVLAYTVATFFAFLAFSFYAFDAYLGYRLNRLCDAQTQTQPQPPV